MNSMFYIALYISFIFSSENKRHMDELALKVDKSTLDIKFTEDDENIIASMKFKDLFIFDPAFWYSENNMVGSTIFYIDGVESNVWESRFRNTDDFTGFDFFLNEISNKIAEFKIQKDKLKDKKGPLEFELKLAKINHLKEFLLELLARRKSVDPTNEVSVRELGKWADKETKSIMTTYVITFNNISNGIPTNFDDYEIVSYKSKSDKEDQFSSYKSESDKKDQFSPTSLLVKSATDVVLHMVLTLGVFGVLIFAGRFSLSKYF